MIPHPSLSHCEAQKAAVVFNQTATRLIHCGLYGAPPEPRDKRRANKLGSMLLPIVITKSSNPIRL